MDTNPQNCSLNYVAVVLEAEKIFEDIKNIKRRSDNIHRMEGVLMELMDKTGRGHIQQLQKIL
ncbi:hypothetical protein TI04_11000 [Achromatium sp. WMS2]|nr:hypothetical protein TI04_11000 [Achromatium sp. WMS2]